MFQRSYPYYYNRKPLYILQPLPLPQMMMSLDCLINEVDVQATIERDDFEKDGGFAYVWVRVYGCVCVRVQPIIQPTPFPLQPPPLLPRPSPCCSSCSTSAASRCATRLKQ